MHPSIVTYSSQNSCSSNRRNRGYSQFSLKRFYSILYHILFCAHHFITELRCSYFLNNIFNKKSKRSVRTYICLWGNYNCVFRSSPGQRQLRLVCSPGCWPVALLTRMHIEAAADRHEYDRVTGPIVGPMKYVSNPKRAGEKGDTGRIAGHS